MYKIIGADGKEYGPITLEQLKQWLAEGRVNSQTQVLAGGATEWRSLAQLPEFAALLSSPPPPVTMAGGLSPGAADQVSGPGIGLIITGILNMVFGALRIVLGVMGLATPALDTSGTSGEMNKMIAEMSGTVGTAFGGIGIICGALILFGGIKMRKLESRGLCLTAAIIAMIPCLSTCCLVGLPAGIWALVVLSKPEVKDAFH